MENAQLTLGFTPEGRFRARAPQLVFTSRLLEGGFPPWREVFPEPSKTTLKVLDPGRLQKALKEAFQGTVQGSRATELRLSGARLGIVVQNDEATFQTDIVVLNLSEKPQKEASVFIDPSYLLCYLARMRAPFVLWFPPERGRPLVFESPGFRYALMPMDRPDTAAAAEASPAKDGPPENAEVPEPPSEEAQSLSA
jgi:DNA polymerase III sliding clamp (beta) subunit (PCNA family)